jgi:peptidoglycan-associated lipoprotein
MSNKIMIGAAVLLWAVPAVPAAAQDRGTMEFGAFATAGSFDNSLSLKSGFGGGGRIGMFLDPRLSTEFEMGEMRATRPTGLSDVNVGILSARLTAVALKSGSVSFLLGAGAGVGTETWFMHSYGVNALAGLKFALNDHAAVRVDIQNDWLANYSWKSYQRLTLGLSMYRNPFHEVRTVTVVGPPAPVAPRSDSVSAEEQARRRRVERDYRALRDSLAQAKAVAPPPSSASALATLEERIHFATDKSELTAESKATLDAKIPLFRANPTMHIIIVGNADQRGTDAYNMALGGRRAVAAKAYLVAQGIDAGRIEITSEGERKPVAAGKAPDALAQNRRDEFRLLIGSDYLVPPKP